MDWISINEKLPDECKSVIVYVTRFNYYPNYISMSHRQDGVWKSEEGTCKKITHWMPLPEPPEGDKQ